MVGKRLSTSNYNTREFLFYRYSYNYFDFLVRKNPCKISNDFKNFTSKNLHLQNHIIISYLIGNILTKKIFSK